MSDEQIQTAAFETASNLFKDIALGAVASVSSKVSDIEDRLEKIEKQIATLVIGYGEQAVFMEALVAQLAFATDKERAAFNTNLSEARQKMLEVMQGASTIMADEDQAIGAAITDLATQKLSDTDS